MALSVLALVACGSMVFLQSNLLWYKRQILAIRAGFLGQDLLQRFPVAVGSCRGKVQDFEYAMDVQREAQGAWLHLTFTQGRYTLVKQSLWRPLQPRRIVFQPFETEEWREVDADGPGQQQLLSAPDEASSQSGTLFWKGQPVWENPAGIEQPQTSADGSQVAFLSGSGSELWVFDRLHNRAACWQRSLQVLDPPCWLDSRTVLVCQAGTQLVQVKSNSPPQVLYEGARLSAPSVSPDGSNIAFISTEDSTNDIFVLALKTRRAINITRSPDGEIRPFWSPQSDRILFALAPVAGGSALWCINPDGSGRQDLHIVAQGNRWSWVRH
ncbi:hypothetical protein ABS71_06860 [bacterium SCN 62-11]|nr:MAG: hypothetical protein ABS71_06860 [bacterium SCN 62-11]